ncbi:MAG: ribosome-associated translation inhibitor RaiA [Candidatus Nanopelagicales bacterium]
MSTEVDIVVRGRHLELTQKFRDHAQDKLGRIAKFGVDLTRIDVEVSKENNPRLADRAFSVELTCRGRGNVIRAEARAEEKYAALDIAYGRLEERVRRAVERRHTRGRRGPAGLIGADEAAAALLAMDGAAVASDEESDTDVVYEDGPVVVREKTHASAPMSVPDALHAMELVGHDFFLFQDIDSGCATVVYKRRGYDYGLLRLDLLEAGGGFGTDHVVMPAVG